MRCAYVLSLFVELPISYMICKNHIKLVFYQEEHAHAVEAEQRYVHQKFTFSPLMIELTRRLALYSEQTEIRIIWV